MDRNNQISDLKEILLDDASYLSNRIDVKWSKPIVEMLRDLKMTKSRVVFFGGVLRSLLISRYFNKRKSIGRPRDIDLVTEGSTIDSLKSLLNEYIVRETRFGGLQLERENWRFDIWPLQNTWAFIKDNELYPNFSKLPFTTFLNLEAIAVDVWPSHNNIREIYSGNNQFFDGILKRTIEINREENPFPLLCVVRSIIMAMNLQFSIGPKLAKYIVNEGLKTDDREFEEIQRVHYGTISYEGRIIKKRIYIILESLSQDENTIIALPKVGQTELF